MTDLSSTELPSDQQFNFLRVLHRGVFGKVVSARATHSGVDLIVYLIRKKADEKTFDKLARYVESSLSFPIFASFENSKYEYHALRMDTTTSLLSYVRAQGRDVDIRKTARTLVESVQRMHKLGLNHGNLTSESIYVVDEHTFRVTAFRLVDDDQVNKWTECTIHYAAPELLAASTEPTIASDWWSVGIILYELSLGMLPFFGLTHDTCVENILNGAIRLPVKINSKLKDLLIQLLDRNAENRLKSSEAIVKHQYFNE